MSTQKVQTISTKYLRDNLAEVLEQVDIGKQTYIIKKFGKVKAQISRPSKSSVSKKEKVDFKKLPGFGMWADRDDMKDSAEWVSKIRKPRYEKIFD